MESTKPASSCPKDKGFGPHFGCWEQILRQWVGPLVVKSTSWKCVVTILMRFRAPFMDLVIRVAMVEEGVSLWRASF